MRALKRIASSFLCVPLALAFVPCVAFGATGHTAGGHVPEWRPMGSDGDVVTASCIKCGVEITNHVDIPIEGEVKASEIAKKVVKETSERRQIPELADSDGVIRVHVDLQIVGDTKFTVDQDLEVQSIVQKVENRAYSLEIYGGETYELTVTEGGIVIGGSVYVKSGKVIAESTNGTAISAEKTVDLSGGSVVATGLTRGLFGGESVTISGDADVVANAAPVSSAKSREFFAGICSDGSINITGGNVLSTAGSMGMSAKGRITISGGTVSVGDEDSSWPAVFSRTGVKVEEPAAVLSPKGVSEVKGRGIAGTAKTETEGYTLGVSGADGSGSSDGSGGSGSEGVTVATHLEMGPKPADPEPDSGNTGEDPGNTGGESPNQGRDPGTGGGTGSEGDDPNNPGGSGGNGGSGDSGDSDGNNSGNSGDSGSGSGNGGTNSGGTAGDGEGGGNSGGDGGNSGTGGTGGTSGNGGNSGGNSGGGNTGSPTSTDPNNTGGTTGVSTNGTTNNTLSTTNNTTNTALNVATRAAAATTGEADGAAAAFNPLRVKGKKSTKSTIKLTWRKVTGATSYVVFGTKCGRSNRYQLLETVAGTSFTDRGLAKGTYYRYFVIALSNGKMLSQSKTVHVATTGGKVTNFKKVTLPFASLTLTPGAVYQLEPTASLMKPALKVKVHKGFRYESSNKKVAKVGKAGKITAKSAGTCYIYAFAQNGIFARVKVTVTA